ncbi:MAG: YaaA family protein, partial [Bacteroidaceae bacterium]|nr:YaaA family protein [Bacteroidaceae bacterium]
MQILLANAKIMNDHSDVVPLTTPMFQIVANELAAEMAMLDIDTLEKELDCSRALAAENWRRYQNFHVAEKLPAIMAYNGQAYKHLKAKTLST